MTATLMGRLFVVPALVVCVLLGVAVVVVFFGASSLEHPASMNDLLDRLQTDPGDKTMGMLFPEARESWQAAQELARRLEDKDRFLRPDQVDPTAERIIDILKQDDAQGGSGAVEGPMAQRGHARKLFLIVALGRLGSPLAVEPLGRLLEDRDEQTRQAVLQALARMGKLPQTRRVLPKVYELLDDPVPAVEMIACLTVAMIAERGDAEAIGQVARKLEADREIQWNAALALSRLGSKRGKLVLMNMLDRSFWEGIDLKYEEDGATVRRKFTEAEVEYRLRAAIDAASRLDDDQLRALVVKLSRNDKSPVVRDAALKACEHGGVDEGPKAGGPEAFGDVRVCGVVAGEVS